jgi:hypothetical protein
MDNVYLVSYINQEVIDDYVLRYPDPYAAFPSLEAAKEYVASRPQEEFSITFVPLQGGRVVSDAKASEASWNAEFQRSRIEELEAQSPNYGWR